jgi:DNA topoisomerase I
MSEWIERRGTKRSGFRYVDANGRVVRARSVVERIASLGIPPAWRDVHVAASARSAIQAWGFDARGRKQYRYHPASVQRGQLRKYYRVRDMGRALPAIRRRIHDDFRGPELTRERVAAAAVRLIGEAFFRVGNERYERENGSFGLTTLRKSHVALDGGRIIFSYRGKSKVEQRQVVVDAELARFVRRLLRSPGARLFRYRDGGRWEDLSARDVNEYLRSLNEVACTAKDFRTWGGTLRLATVLSDLGPGESEREAKRNVTTALRLVAADLGNTPAICRTSYVHPIVIAQYLDEGETIEAHAGGHVRRRSVIGSPVAHTPEERALLAFLDRHFPERRRAPRRGDDDSAAKRRRRRLREGRRSTRRPAARRR